MSISVGCHSSHSKIGEYCIFILAKECGYWLIIRRVWGILVSGVLCLVSVHRGSSTCMPSIHMSVVADVFVFLQVCVCVGTISCCYICIDWTVVRIGRRGSMSAYIIWRRVGGGVNLHGLECTCHNWGKVRVLINAFMCTYVIWVCPKVTGCAYIDGGELRVYLSISSTYSKLWEVGLDFWMFLCVYVELREVGGIPMQCMSALYVCYSVRILQLQGWC